MVYHNIIHILYLGVWPVNRLSLVSIVPSGTAQWYENIAGCLSQLSNRSFSQQIYHLDGNNIFHLLSGRLNVQSIFIFIVLCWRAPKWSLVNKTLKRLPLWFSRMPVDLTRTPSASVCCASHSYALHREVRHVYTTRTSLHNQLRSYLELWKLENIILSRKKGASL